MPGFWIDKTAGKPFQPEFKYYLSPLGRSCYVLNLRIGEREAEPPEFVPRLRLGTRK